MLPRAVLISVCLAALASALQAIAAPAPTTQKASGGAIIWDISQRGLFDPTNKAYPIDEGRVRVDLEAGDVKCPSGLGELSTGRPDVKEVHLRFQSRESGDMWLHVLWDPGRSGREQFAVLCNGQQVGESQLIDAALQPSRKIASRFKMPLQKGPSDITLVYLSGDGMRLENIVLSRTEDYSAGTELPPTLSPDLKYPTPADYEKAIKEPAVMLDSPHVRLFAPRRKTAEANIIFLYLVKAYDELYKIVGVHTRYKIVVYHLLKGDPDAFGGTYSDRCSIWYNCDNLDLASKAEWKSYMVPHVSGYIEEMAHDFVHTTRATFGDEIVGWTIGTKVTQIVADNPVLARDVEDSRRKQSETFARYVKGDYVFPRDIEPNLCDRVYGWVLYQAELKYGPNFWPDFFTRIRQQEGPLFAVVHMRGEDEQRNARYRITIDCFDSLAKIHFKDALRQAHISLTTDLVCLHPTGPTWDRRFVPAAEKNIYRSTHR